MGKGPEHSLSELETVRSELPPEELVVNPGSLLDSLANIIARVPEGKSYFMYNPDTHVLKPVSAETCRKDFAPYAIGIEKGLDSDGVVARIAEATVMIIDNLTELPHLDIILDRNGSLKRARFDMDIHDDPSICALFDVGSETGPTSIIEVNMKIISQLLSFALKYQGDHCCASFRGLESFAPQELEILFKNGQVPNIDIQAFIHDLLIKGDPRASRRLSLPKLTFDANRYDYHPFHSRTFLVREDRRLPVVAVGEVIEGVAITESFKKPFHVKVELHDIKEVPYNYTNAKGTAVEINASVTIGEGEVSQCSFIIPSSLKYLKQNPQLIPSAAFKESTPSPN